MGMAAAAEGCTGAGVLAAVPGWQTGEAAVWAWGAEGMGAVAMARVGAAADLDPAEVDGAGGRRGAVATGVAAREVEEASVEEVCRAAASGLEVEEKGRGSMVAALVQSRVGMGVGKACTLET